ncbi:MAG: glycosyltransferase [Fibromonadaceae bacterium]|jgi:glycosyltransferase involved in cell wall biosynthesis|nr:glycosyltransferase [Fibromonadaceae bacterium]
MKIFALYLPWFSEVEKNKDTGKILEVLERDFGYKGQIFGIKKGNPANRKPNLEAIKFIIKNARKIDVLQFYHEQTKVIAFLYKMLNPKGIVYVKTDRNLLALQKSMPEKVKLKHILFKPIYNFFRPNLYTIETTACYELQKKLIPKMANRLQILPNGIDFHQLKELGFEHPKKTDKENIIITVGRIGAFPKNNEMMLEALNGLDLKDWRFVLIGPIYDETNIKFDIEQFYLNNPSLKDKVIFTGGIYDKKELYSWYKKASVFCLTSEWESWCLSLSDAIYFGCEIISTNVGCFDDITNNDFGYKIEKANDLRILLEKIVNGQINTLQNFEKIIERSKEFDWHSICGRLDKMLEECR